MMRRFVGGRRTDSLGRKSLERKAKEHTILGEKGHVPKELRKNLEYTSEKKRSGVLNFQHQ